MIKIDTENGWVSRTNPHTNQEEKFPIGSQEAFSIISDAWLRSGWDTKYVYSFSWLGRPIIQLPEDMIRIQEIIYNVKPDIVIETGIAHGGGLIYYASLLSMIGHGRVIGVDIEIRPHNRKAIEEHKLYSYIEMFEGSSISPEIVEKVKQSVGNKSCLVLLDSNHHRDHVLNELRAYSQFVGENSYIIACDGIMKDVVGAPRTEKDWDINNPQSAVQDFLKENSDFVLDEPKFPFNEGVITKRVTYWKNAFLKRVKK